MGASIIACSRAGGESYSCGTTSYQYPGGATELDSDTNARWYTSRAGVLKAIELYVDSNTCNQTVEVAFRKEGTTSAVKASISASATGWQSDATGDELSIAAGEHFNIEFTSAAGTGSLTYSRLLFVFVSDTGGTAVTFVNFNNTSSTGINNVSETVYFGPYGARERDVTESGPALEAPIGGTVEYYQGNFGTNQRTTTTTCTFRSDTTDRSPTFDVAATDGSPHQDTTNTYSMAANESLSYGLAMGSDSGNTFNVEKMGFCLANSSDEFFIAATDPVGGTNILDGTSGFICPAGILSTYATEADAQLRIPDGLNVDIIGIAAESDENTLTGDDVVFTLRKGGADTALTLTFPTGGTDTGYFSDTGAVSVEGGDLICVDYDALTSTGTRLRLGQIVLIMKESAASGGITPLIMHHRINQGMS